MWWGKWEEKGRAKSHLQGDCRIIFLKTPFPHQVFLCRENLFLSWINLGTMSPREGPDARTDVQTAQLTGRNVLGRRCDKAPKLLVCGYLHLYTPMPISGPAASCSLPLSPAASHSTEPKYHSIWYIPKESSEVVWNCPIFLMMAEIIPQMHNITPKWPETLHKDCYHFNTEPHFKTSPLLWNPKWVRPPVGLQAHHSSSQLSDTLPQSGATLQLCIRITWGSL